MFFRFNGATYITQGLLGFSTFAVGVQCHFDIKFCLTILSDGEECFAVVE